MGQLTKKWKTWMHWVVVGLLTLLIVGCLLGYSDYIQRQIYYESTENLLETYEQVDKTIMMFAQRNWNVLSDWSRHLQYLSDNGELETQWQEIGQDKDVWRYSDFYLFNPECQFRTVAGRQGVAEHARRAFETLYAAPEDRGVVSSYTATDGKRKVVFEIRTDPVELDGITYTGLAVSYDNDVLEDMMGGGAYNGQSDCYIVYPGGTVLMSTEPKSEIPTRLKNLFDFLEENAAINEKTFAEMRQAVRNGESGSIFYRYQGRNYYLVYQPSGLDGKTIIGIVDRSVVESGMRNVQYITILMLTVLAVCILAAIVMVVLLESERKLKQEAAERKMLAHQKELASQLFNGISRVADRFAICDLAHNEYEYHERKGQPLYKENGTYDELIRYLNDRYIVLTDGEEAKFSQLMEPETLRTNLKTKEDMLRYEYCSRDKSVYLVMYIIPVFWEGDTLSQVMLISQDMGRQHELENLANTDGLTGLFNGRFFTRVLKLKEEKQQSFVLFYLDLDRFKPINDTYGHDMGDKLLQEVSRRLQGCIRNSDYAFRIGGDEFALIVNGSMDEPLRKARIEKIREAILVPITIDGITVTVGTSCGSAVYPAESRSTEEIRVLADQRMYEDKEQNHAGR